MESLLYNSLSTTESNLLKLVLATVWLQAPSTMPLSDCCQTAGLLALLVLANGTSCFCGQIVFFTPDPASLFEIGKDDDL